MTALALLVAPPHRHSHHWLTSGYGDGRQMSKKASTAKPKSARCDRDTKSNTYYTASTIFHNRHCKRPAMYQRCSRIALHILLFNILAFLGSPFLFFIALFSPLTPDASFAFFGTRQGVSNMAKMFQDHGQHPHLLNSVSNIISMTAA